jgi:rhamnogalacturonyl hydrolase YesR
MGTVLVARMAPLFKRFDYAAEVTRQQIGFAKRLRDPVDGLNFHGFNDKDGHVSCCKWGRGQCASSLYPVASVCLLCRFLTLWLTFVRT